MVMLALSELLFVMITADEVTYFKLEKSWEIACLFLGSFCIVGMALLLNDSLNKGWKLMDEMKTHPMKTTMAKTPLLSQYDNNGDVVLQQNRNERMSPKIIAM